MSLSKPISAPSEDDGYARKVVSVQLPKKTQDAKSPVLQLRRFFAPRSDVQDKDKLLSSIERYLEGQGSESACGEVIRGALTRKQRKVARRLGFVVKHQGHSFDI